MLRRIVLRFLITAVASGLFLYSLNFVKAPAFLIDFLYNSERSVKACVLNDVQNPAPENLLNPLLSVAFQEYKEKVGIQFTVVARAYYDPEILLKSENEMVAHFHEICNPKSEAKFAFTNSGITKGWDKRGQEKFVLDGHKSNSGNKIAGYAQDPFGVVRVYGFKELLLTKSPDQKPVIIKVILHEIGHLFDVPHDSSPESFMYKDTSSRGRWTSEVI